MKTLDRQKLLIELAVFVVGALGFVKLCFDLIAGFIDGGEVINPIGLCVSIVFVCVSIVFFIMNYLRNKDLANYEKNLEEIEINFSVKLDSEKLEFANKLREERLEFEKKFKVEQLAHQETTFQRDNFEQRLDIAMRELVSDFTTGIPNFFSLRSFFEKLEKLEAQRLQYILIDLKGFKAINDEFKSLKTNVFIRFVAQSIYRKMRRDEHMFRLNDGGDEFVVILEGNQPDALGFANRLAEREFKYLSIESERILGVRKDLSFHCAIVEINSKEKLESIRQRVEVDCYSHIDKEKGKFNICWHPNKENEYETDSFERRTYEKTREIFYVHSMDS